MPSLISAADHVIGLGSNLGDRASTLAQAVQALARFARIQAVSAVYESDAMGPPQPRYLNAAVRLGSELGAQELMAALLGVERDFGRERRERWGPRTLDLDWLWSSNGLVLSEPGLRVPHPGLRERRFALEPLLDVAPEARDPVTDERYRDVLERLLAPEIERIAEARSFVDLGEIMRGREPSASR